MATITTNKPGAKEESREKTIWPLWDRLFRGSEGYLQDERGKCHTDQNVGPNDAKSPGRPLYDQRYKDIGPFTGDFAPVVDHNMKAFHIRRDGSPLYPQRYLNVGDFNGSGLALAETYQGFYHIFPDGNRAYKLPELITGWEWASDFVQDEKTEKWLAWVLVDNRRFQIDTNGKEMSTEETELMRRLNRKPTRE